MTLNSDKVKEEYFNWLYDTVCEGRAHDNTSYKELFMFLHDIEFTFTIRNDSNRARDGVELRYKFAMLNDDEYVLPILDGPCSVLEMMVALSVRCETIMDDTRYGDRTGQWFWGMMTSLGIGNMYDERFNIDVAEEKIAIFLNREYAPDGKGGLFYIRGCQEDLRDVEIWTQLCWYLDKFA